MCWSTILWMLAANTKFSRQKLNPKWRERLWISMIQLKMNSFFFCNCQWNRYHDGFFFQWWENWSYGWLGKDTGWPKSKSVISNGSESETKHFWPHVCKVKIGLRGGSFLWQKLNFWKSKKNCKVSAKERNFCVPGEIWTRDL